MTSYTTTQERIAPQHRMGIAMDEGTTLPDAMLEAFLLGWNVRATPLLTAVPVPEQELPMLHRVPGKVATVRNDPRKGGEIQVLGAGMTKGYTVIQNEEVAEFVQNVLDVSGDELVVDAAGDWMNGCRAFVNLRRPDDVLVGGIDRVREFIFVSWGHDSGTSVNIQGQGMRMFCTNQIGGMLGDATAPRFKVRHVGAGVEGRVNEARLALKIMASGKSALEEEMERWASKDLNDGRFNEILLALLPDLAEDAKPAQVTKREEDRGLLNTLYRQDPASGTAWGALNAWTEMGDWFGRHADDQARALAQLTSPTLEHRRVQGARTIADRAGLTLVA